MPASPLGAPALDTLFRDARTRYGWADTPVSPADPGSAL